VRAWRHDSGIDLAAGGGRIRRAAARLRPLVFAAAAIASLPAGAAPGDWTQFGWDVGSSAASPEPTGITASNAPALKRRQVSLDGTVDASAIYLHAVDVQGARHDVFFVTTTYGKTIAIDAEQGTILWEYTPPGYAAWEGTRQITTSTPAADPDREHLYAAAPDGTIRKLAVADGHVVWAAPVTLLAAREKIASPLREFHGHIIAVTGGYIGDKPPYQGHVAVLDAHSGRLLHVWNSLCSDRAYLLVPRTCSSTQSAIWGRAGAVIDAATGDLFVATGNGPYDGKTDWGDSIVELDADATRMLGNYTPADNRELDRRDLDLGSTSPVLLGHGLLAQGGKDKLIRLISVRAIAGTTPHEDHELQTVPTPSEEKLVTAPAVWRHEGAVWMFAADDAGTAAWVLEDGRLVQKWKNDHGGTSPVVAGGLLYVYDPRGGLHVYQPTSGDEIANLQCGPGHWNSPIVVDGKIALPEGSANEHALSGVLDIWSAAPAPTRP